MPKPGSQTSSDCEDERASLVVDLHPDDGVHLEGVVQDRLEEIARQTNVSVDKLSGTIQIDETSGSGASSSGTGPMARRPRPLALVDGRRR